MDKDELGRRGEAFAARHLEAQGYEILDRNWRVREGELDIVARDGDALVVVEVKTRSSSRYGYPVEAIDREKARRLRLLATQWRRTHSVRTSRMRIDAIGIIAAKGEPVRVSHVRAVA
ncbi:YraN family protein [Microbacteriaceae bacterium VKM Ac-2855]|nr:YraN family protein [Microbacteriaceae bacterium VKM Ac-2855]